MKLEPVIDGLASSGAHPLKGFAFGAHGRLYFNLGSATDACRDAAGQQPLPCPGRVRPGAAGLARLRNSEATLGPAPAFARLHDYGDAALRPRAERLRDSVALALAPGPDVRLQGATLDRLRRPAGSGGAARPGRETPSPASCSWPGTAIGPEGTGSSATRSTPRGCPRRAEVWVDGWAAARGVRPLGAPTGLAVDAAGRLLIVEDRHKTLLMLAREAD